MIDGRGGRILSILAAVLIMVALAVTLAIILLRIPDNRKFDESILSAEFALSEGSQNLLKRELLRASRHAVSAANWRRILTLSASSISQNPSSDDYKLFTVLAGRASSSVPGDNDFPAYWIWGLLRSGDTTKAAQHIGSIDGNEWLSLRAEIKLKTAVGDSEEEIKLFLSGIEERPDPEFLEHAAMLTESAELTFDAALLYMLNGKPEKAYEMADILMRNERRWADTEIFARRGVAAALAGMAQDAGHKDDAIKWLTMRLDDTRRRRVSSWESLQILGDLYWEQYQFQGKTKYRDDAGEAWNEAMELIYISKEEVELPDDSWRLWVNLAVLEQSAGNIRASEGILNEALVLFPERNEVKAAWARELWEAEPALARRLIRSSMTGTNDPVLGITAMKVDPEAVTPRLYEARLWELFESVTSGDDTVQSTDGRILTTFLLDYMASRKNLSSVDVAIDRYLKIYPDDKWILSWRMAADAARGMALIDLVAPAAGEISPAEDFRILARAENSWRALHDSALYSMMASDELKKILKHFPETASRDDSDILEAAILEILKPHMFLPHISGTPLEDRIGNLLKSREDLSGFGKNLDSSGKRGAIARSQAAAAFEESSTSLLEKALEDLSQAGMSAENLAAEDRAALLYLEALILRKSGRLEESVNRARAAAEAEPDHAGVRELLMNEVTL